MNLLLLANANYCPMSSGWCKDHPFLFGMGLGAGTILVLLGLILLLWKLHTSKSVRQITIPSENGDIQVSVSAISDLIYSLDREFPEFTVVRVSLLQLNKELVLEVLADFSAPSEKTFQTLAAEFQSKALSCIRNSFGIAAIARIPLKIRHHRSI